MNKTVLKLALAQCSLLFFNYNAAFAQLTYLEVLGKPSISTEFISKPGNIVQTMGDARALDFLKFLILNAAPEKFVDIRIDLDPGTQESNPIVNFLKTHTSLLSKASKFNDNIIPYPQGDPKWKNMIIQQRRILSLIREIADPRIPLNSFEITSRRSYLYTYTNEEERSTLVFFDLSKPDSSFSSQDYAPELLQSFFHELLWKINTFHDLLERGLNSDVTDDFQRTFPEIFDSSSDFRKDLKAIEDYFSSLADQLLRQLLAQSTQIIPDYDILDLTLSKNISANIIGEVKDFITRAGYITEKQDLINALNLGQGLPAYHFLKPSLMPSSFREELVWRQPSEFAFGSPHGLNPFRNEKTRVSDHYSASHDYNGTTIFTGPSNCSGWVFSISNSSGQPLFLNTRGTAGMLEEAFDTIRSDELRFGDLIYYDLGDAADENGKFREFHIFMYLGTDAVSGDTYVLTKNGRAMVPAHFSTMEKVKSYYDQITETGIVDTLYYRRKPQAEVDSETFYELLWRYAN